MSRKNGATPPASCALTQVRPISVLWLGPGVSPSPSTNGGDLGGIVLAGSPRRRAAGSRSSVSNSHVEQPDGGASCHTLEAVSNHQASRAVGPSRVTMTDRECTRRRWHPGAVTARRAMPMATNDTPAPVGRGVLPWACCPRSSSDEKMASAHGFGGRVFGGTAAVSVPTIHLRHRRLKRLWACRPRRQGCHPARRLRSGAAYREALKPGMVTEIIIGGRAIAVANVEGTFRACVNACPHADGPLGEGSLEGGLLTCPYHGWQFDLESGACPTNPEVTLTTYEVQVVEDAVCVKI